MAKWLDKYDVPKAQNGIEGTMGGLTDKGFNYNGAWGGPSMQDGGPITPMSNESYDALRKEYEEFYTPKVPYRPIQDDGFDAFYKYKTKDLTKVPRSQGPGWLIKSDESEMFVPSEKGVPMPKKVEKKAGKKTFVEDYVQMEENPLKQFYSDVTLDFVKKAAVNKSLPPHQRMKTGGSLPGSAGFTYARTGSTPSNGKYAKKTKASAQDGKKLSYGQWKKQYNLKETPDYNLKRAWELGYTPDKTGHLPTVDNQTGQFLKAKGHPTLQLELDWYNSPEAADFRSKNAIDSSGKFFKYVPKGQNGKYIKDKVKGIENKLQDRFIIPDLRKVFKEANKQGIDYGEHNGPLDAIRHAASASKIASSVPIVGLPLANILGVAHEISTNGGNRKELLSDLYNNFIGSVIGSVPFISNNTRRKLVIDAQKSGILSTIDNTRFENGGSMKYYQEGLDFKPKTISKNGSWLNKYDKAQDGKNLPIWAREIPRSTGDIQNYIPTVYLKKTKEEAEKEALEAAVRNAIANQPVIRQATTPIDKEKTKKKNKQYAQSTGRKYNENTGAVEERFTPNEERVMNRVVENIIEPALFLEGAVAAAPLVKKGLQTAGKYATENTALRNAYKLNPWAFKANPEAHYRMLGKEGYADALESGIIRANPSGNYTKPYFSSGRPLDMRDVHDISAYEGPYMAEVKNKSFTDPYEKLAGQKTGIGVPDEILNVSDRDISLYKQHWLKGYKELPKPTTKNLSNSNISKNVSNKLSVLKENINAQKYRIQRYTNKDFREALNRDVDEGNAWSQEWFSHPTTLSKYDDFVVPSVPYSDNFINKLSNLLIPTAMPAGNAARKNLEILQKTGAFTKPEKTIIKNPFRIFDSETNSTFGYYSPLKNKAYVDLYNPYANRSQITNTVIHENAHAVTGGTRGISEKFNKEFQDAFDVGKNSYEKYLVEPTESYSRINELRYALGLKPDTKISDMLVDKIIEVGKTGATGIDKRWFELIKDKDKLKWLLNNVPVVTGAIGAASTLGEKKYQDGGEIPVDPDGYWNPENWGNPVIIPSNIITMEGVDQPLIGISDTGDIQYMEPGEDYEFDGEYVTEYPVAKNGVSVNNADAQPIKKLDQLLNFTNYNKPTKGGWLDKYN